MHEQLHVSLKNFVHLMVTLIIKYDSTYYIVRIDKENYGFHKNVAKMNNCAI